MTIRGIFKTIAKYSTILLLVLLVGCIGAAEQSVTSADFWKAIIAACVDLVLLAGSVYALEYAK